MDKWFHFFPKYYIVISRRFSGQGADRTGLDPCSVRFSERGLENLGESSACALQAGKSQHLIQDNASSCNRQLETRKGFACAFLVPLNRERAEIPYRVSKG